MSGSIFSFSSPGEGEASGPEHVLTRSGKLVDGYLWKSTSDSSWERKEEQLERTCCVPLSSLRVFLTLSRKAERRAHQRFTLQFFNCYKHLPVTSLCAWTADTLNMKNTSRTAHDLCAKTLDTQYWQGMRPICLQTQTHPAGHHQLHESSSRAQDGYSFLVWETNQGVTVYH